MNLQTRYDLEIAEDKIAAKVERDVQPLETVAARQCTKSPATKAPALRLPTVAKIQMFRVSRPAELLGRPGVSRPPKFHIKNSHRYLAHCQLLSGIAHQHQSTGGANSTVVLAFGRRRLEYICGRLSKRVVEMNQSLLSGRLSLLVYEFAHLQKWCVNYLVKWCSGCTS